MGLPKGTYVQHLNRNGLDCRPENLRLMRGRQRRQDRPEMVVCADEGERTIYLHDLIMEQMRAEGHPNARLEGDRA